MPDLSGPLASFSARGKIGGHRKGVTTRLRFYVNDYAPYGFTPGNISTPMGLNTRVWVSAFWLPFHMQVKRAAVQVNSHVTPGKIKHALFDASGATRLGLSNDSVTLSNNGLVATAFPSVINLVPGMYWHAIIAVTSPIDVSVYAQDPLGTGPMEAGITADVPPLAGILTGVTANTMPLSFDPKTLTVGTANRIPGFRLLAY